MTNIPVQYAMPRRQILVIVGGVLLLIGGITALALTLRSGGLSAGLALACMALFIWWLIRNVNGDGEASLDERGLEIVPRRSCFCAGSGPVRIGWDEIEKVQMGATNAPNQPRLFVILRIREPRRSWIITPRRAEDADFARKVLELANAARSHSGAAPLEPENPYDSPWWRAAAVLCLLSFAGGIVAIIFTGKMNDLYVWGRVLLVGAFALPLARQVFGSRTKR